MNAPLPDFLLPLPGGVYAIDTGFHRDRFDAAYLVVHGGFYEDPETFSKIQTTLLHRADLERVTAARFAGGLSELYRFR